MPIRMVEDENQNSNDNNPGGGGGRGRLTRGAVGPRGGGDGAEGLSGCAAACGHVGDSFQVK